MPAIINIARAATGPARLVANVLTAPVRIGAAVLDSSRVARRDPASNRLAELRHDGWRPSEVRFGARTIEVDLERDGRHETIEGTTLAFAAYAGRVGVAAGAPVVSAVQR